MNHYSKYVSLRLLRMYVTQLFIYTSFKSKSSSSWNQITYATYIFDAFKIEGKKKDTHQT